jgi:hypothetical protein
MSEAMCLIRGVSTALFDSCSVCSQPARGASEARKLDSDGCIPVYDDKLTKRPSQGYE